MSAIAIGDRVRIIPTGANVFDLDGRMAEVATFSVFEPDMAIVIVGGKRYRVPIAQLEPAAKCVCHHAVHDGRCAIGTTAGRCYCVTFARVGG